jgi:hypothetical protein
MAWALTQSGFSLWLVSVMAGVPGGSWGFLAITIVAFIILGSVLEGLPAIVLFGPLLFPVAKAVGVNEVHYAMVVILAMGTQPRGFGSRLYKPAARHSRVSVQHKRPDPKPSARQLRPPSSARHPPVDPFEQHRELRPAQHHHALLSPRPHESPPLS